MVLRTLIFLLCLSLFACGGEAETDEGASATNPGGKTDTPDDAPEDSCTKRRADANTSGCCRAM